MKKLCAIAAFAAALSLAAACDKNSETTFTPVQSAGEQAKIALSISGDAATKATVTGSEAENAINTVDIFVFFKGGEYDGRLDAYGHYTSGPYELNATTGDREIYVIVNSEHGEAALGAIPDKSTLLSLAATLPSQKNASGAAGNFTMAGAVSRSAATALIAGTNNIEVKVSRLVARVRVMSITAAFESPAIAAQPFSIDAIYLSNAVTKDVYGAGYEPVVADFANKLGEKDAAFDPWLYRNAAACELYTMPNPVDTDSEDKPFTLRNTKLVVKTTLNGKASYYVIPLGEVKGNTSYDISELVITRPGSSDPDKKTELSSCFFAIEVNPWTVKALETEEGTGKYVI